MKIHLGQAILKALEKKGMNKTEFGRRINKSDSTVHDILRRKSIDTDLLTKISSVLEQNFFLLFTKSSALGNPDEDALTRKIEGYAKEIQTLKKQLRDKDRIIALHEKKAPQKKAAKKRK